MSPIHSSFGTFREKKRKNEKCLRASSDILCFFFLLRVSRYPQKKRKKKYLRMPSGSFRFFFFFPESPKVGVEWAQEQEAGGRRGWIWGSRAGCLAGEHSEGGPRDEGERSEKEGRGEGA